MTTFHDIEMNAINGEPVKFESFKGSTCLLVNVASR